MSQRSGNMVGIGKTISVGGLNGLTGGLGQTVLNISASDLGDGVAVLNLDGDNLDLGVVNTVLGGDLTASVLHGGDSRVGNSVGNGGNVGNGSSNSGVSQRGGGDVAGITVESISIGISLSIGLSLHNMSIGSGSVTEDINDILAHLLVFNLLGLDGLGVAHVLGGGGTGLGNKDLLFGDTVGGGASVVGDGGNRGGSSNYGSSSQGSGSQGSGGVVAEELGVSISICVSRWSSMSSHGEEKDGQKLVHDEIVLHFPRCKFELK